MPNKQVFNKSKKRVDLFNKRCKVATVNGDNENDRLEILRRKYEQEIQAKQQELEVLKAKLADLVAFTQESDRLINPDSDSDLGRYAGLGITESALDAIGKLWGRGRNQLGLAATEIGNYMIAHGYEIRTERSSFNIALAITLKRLAESGRIKMESAIGRNYFGPQNERVKAPIRGRTLRPRSLR